MRCAGFSFSNPNAAKLAVKDLMDERDILVIYDPHRWRWAMVFVMWEDKKIATDFLMCNPERDSKGSIVEAGAFDI